MTAHVKLLRIQDLAEILGLSPKTVSNRLSQIRSGSLTTEALPPTRLLNGRPRWRSDEVQAWIDSAVTLEGVQP